MARNREPIVKQSRREGAALEPKAHKVMVRRKALPGERAGARRSKTTQYGQQLRQKQKVKRMYGLLEKQFRRLVEEAERERGITGEILLQLLERRLDNVVYRLQLASSRRAARQLVNHGHIMLNGRRVDVPSIRVTVGDEITIRPKSAKNAYFQSLDIDQDVDLSWLSFDPTKLRAKVTGVPRRDEAEPDISEQLIIEFYSRQ
ncbi:30S ribosomal protein S4 [Candidatus Saccharibacteria bacterium SW_7_54_9]|nr:MAG: 30S ribosomal protein S4 [Candidatus Saccharibacteria bacterium SW_7_54_9]